MDKYERNAVTRISKRRREFHELLPVKIKGKVVKRQIKEEEDLPDGKVLLEFKGF